MANPKKALEAMNAAFEALEELDEAERQRAMTWLGETLGTSMTAGALVAPPPTPDGGNPPPTGVEDQAEGTQAQDQTPKEFVASKQPATDVERLTCLAYYLTKVRGTPEFNTGNLTALNTEAAGRRFTNAAATGKNATAKSGYLTGATGKKRQITHLGEQVVEAMPDRDAVKAIVAAAPKPRKRPNRSKAKTAASS